MNNRMNDNLVGLMCDHTPDLLIGLMGILKSGCAFVPIDPSNPIERINKIFNDCQIEILLTQEKYLDKARKISLSNHVLKHIICLDQLPDRIHEDSAVKIYGPQDFAEKEPLAQIPDENTARLAYTIYTSGSTGTPKGIPIS